MAEHGTDMLLAELLRMSQKELGCINEVYRLTAELADAFSKNDQKSARILIGMRGASLSELERIRGRRMKFLEASGEKRMRMERLMQGGSVPEMNEMEMRLMRLAGSFKSELERTVELDRRVNKRIAQDKTYYQE